jgi:hypothetical protein
MAANGFLATGLFPCDKNIFRPYDFPLSSEDTHAASVNHPASVNTSDQPSSSSANFSPFTSAVPLRSSDISSVPSLNLKQNPRDGTEKKITSSAYNKFVEATQKKKIKQATRSKTNWLESNALLGPSKRRKRRVWRDRTPSDTPSVSDNDTVVPSAEDLTQEEIHDADCLFYTSRFSEDHNGEDWIRYAKSFRCLICIKFVDKVSINMN